jgi:hypothetical protein
MKSDNDLRHWTGRKLGCLVRKPLGVGTTMARIQVLVHSCSMLLPRVMQHMSHLNAVSFYTLRSISLSTPITPLQIIFLSFLKNCGRTEAYARFVLDAVHRGQSTARWKRSKCPFVGTGCLLPLLASCYSQGARNSSRMSRYEAALRWDVC